MRTIEISELRRLTLARLRQRFSKEASERMAEVILFGELSGRASHGIQRLLPGSYGPLDEEPGPAPTIERPRHNSARVHGRPGMLVASIACDLAIDLASDSGMSAVTARGSRSTSGSLNYFVERMTEAGMVAMISANTLAFVTPHGGKGRLLGTNPLAMGVPSSGRPFIIDMATSASNVGEVMAAAAAGTTLSPGIAVDSSGNETRSPSDVLDGGALLPFGGHKGLGLAMMIELMNGVLAGAGAAPTGSSDGWGHVFVAMSLEAFGDPDELRQRAQEIIERFESAPTVDERPPRIPGRASLDRRDQALVRGTVEVDDEAFDQLVSLVGGFSAS